MVKQKNEQKLANDAYLRIERNLAPRTAHIAPKSPHIETKTALIAPKAAGCSYAIYIYDVRSTKNCENV